MKIYTLWAQRTDNHNYGLWPELLVAWDEYCIEGNEEGYEEAVKEAIERNGGLGPGKGLSAVREVIIEVLDSAIEAAFEVPEILGVVRPGTKK